MVRESPIGIEQFDEVIQQDCFYVDKTEFIKSWWSSKSKTTLITRPRRFGKTLTMSMLNCFFSVQYASRGDLFQNLNIWQYKEYQDIQGTYPVIFLSFAKANSGDFQSVKKLIFSTLGELYDDNLFLLSSGQLSENEVEQFKSVKTSMDSAVAVDSVYFLSKYLSRYYNKKVIILLDEYDTPMITAYNKGYWEELTDFMRMFFNATFKTNPYLAKGLMTGITRVAKESMFSGLNNLKVVTTTSPEYADVFGFTEEEVFTAMDEQGKSESEKQAVKRYYDGFTFGNRSDIYNPWSILNYFDTGIMDSYWAKTSSNELITKLIKEGAESLKQNVTALLSGDRIQTTLSEFISFSDLDEDDVVWSLLVSAGYLRVDSKEGELYTLSITNYEMKEVFRDAIRRMVKNGRQVYGKFAQALLSGNIEEINNSIKEFAEASFSFYDMKKKKPENFYHGFVLGLIAELFETHIIRSNRESGSGRADVWLYRKDKTGDAIIMEFKALNKKSGEKALSDTVAAALKQIEEKKYDTDLKNEGFDNSRIRKYGFAFRKKEVLVGGE